MSNRKPRKKAKETITRSEASTTRKNYVNWALGSVLTVGSVIARLRSSKMDPVTMLLIGGGILWVWIAFKYSAFSEKKPWSVLRHFQQQAFWWCITGLVLGVSPCLALWTWIEKSTVKFATLDELIPSVLQNKTIRIADLAMQDFRIQSRTFENCIIYGPAVLLGVNCNMYECIVETDSEGGFIKTTNKAITGAIRFENCVFRRCSFKKIGFIGTPDQMDEMKSQVTFLNALPPGGLDDLRKAKQGQRIEKE